MKKFILLSVFGLIIFSAGIQNSFAQKYTPNQINIDTLIRVLSSDSVEGRKPGTSGIEKAARYIEQYFSAIGLHYFFPSSFRDTFRIGDVETYNLVGLINANTLNDEYIVIGAHLDHLGMKKNSNDDVFNGANDNASGVAAVIKIASVLKEQTFNKKVIIAIFSGEEKGLLGAMHLATRLKDMQINLRYVINFDMIGYPLTQAPGKVYLTGYNLSDFAIKANEFIGESFINQVSIDASNMLFRAADNYPFYLKFGIPAHTVSTFDFTNYPYYHRPDDEYKYIDISNTEKIVERMTAVLTGLLEADTEINLIRE